MGNTIGTEGRHSSEPQKAHPMHWTVASEAVQLIKVQFWLSEWVFLF